MVAGFPGYGRGAPMTIEKTWAVAVQGLSRRCPPCRGRRVGKQARLKQERRRLRAVVPPVRRAPKPLRQAAAVAVVALAVCAAGIAGNLVSRPGPAPPKLAGAAEAAALFRGIPQERTALGRPDAPLTLAIYVDPQCPYCGVWDRQALPAIVERYIRPGTLRAEYRGLAFVGPDSERGLRALLAAGEQHRLFQAETLLYANQGVENSGWLSESFVASLAASLPGLDASRLTTDLHSAAVDTAIRTAVAQQHVDGVKGTPTLLVGPTGGILTPVELRSLEPQGTIPAIDQALAELSS
jgi:protein-disulfide isomerase